MNVDKYNRFGIYSDYHFKSEMEVLKHYHNLIKNHFNGRTDLTILEIGAGFGNNLAWFNYMGIDKENLFANEPDPLRVGKLKRLLPEKNILTGYAQDLALTKKFDIILQSTVFTSVPDSETKRAIAKNMFNVLNDNGVFLWYDFKYDSPNNKSVKGINKSEVSKLFPRASKINFASVTLLPPLGRRMGLFYNTLNFLLPFLRTHLVAVIQK